MTIKNNQLIYSVSPWDIEFEGQTLTIREKARKFLLRITFQPPNKVLIDKGRFLYNGVEILLDSNFLLVTNNNTLIRGCHAINCQGGLIIGPLSQPIGGFMRIEGVNRYLGNTKASLDWAKSIEHELLGSFKPGESH
jgi:trigger factor